MEPLQTRLRLLFSESKTDVTEDLMPDLLSFSYTDKENAEADEVTLTLKDPDGKWASKWKPDGGEMVQAFLSAGTVLIPGIELSCGTFYADTLRVSGSPRVFEMWAVSVPMNKPIRRRLRTRAWEKTTLKAIAVAIAGEAGVGLLFDTQSDPEYDRQDQSKESDLAFLVRLTDEAGFSLKVTDEQLVVFDQAAYEKKAPVETLTLGTSQILSWEFESAQSESYRTCTVSYRDPKQKTKQKAGGYDFNLRPVSGKSTNPAVMTYTATDPDADPNGQEYALKRRAKSLEEAKRLATAKLRSLNRRRVTGRLSVVGDVMLVAGAVVECRGFGSFDGNFIIEEAVHSLDSSGHRTDISLRRVNNAY